MKIRIVNGPNLNFLGIREVDKYGDVNYDKFCNNIIEEYKKDLDIEVFQSNSEGEIIDYIQKCYFESVDGIIINAGALTHYSYSLNDCIKSVNIPTIEVHITNIYNREEYRRKSVISESCLGVISGFGLQSYNMAIDFFLNSFKNVQKN